MKLSLYLLSPCAVFALAACAHTGAANEAHKDATLCHDAYAEDHGSDAVQQFKVNEQMVYNYRHFFFTRAAPASLVDFINEHHIQMVIDLRADASHKDLPERYPAVYWSYSFDALDKIDHKNIQQLEEQLDTFADKTIMFVSTSGDAAIATFTEYWAAANSLNDTWIDRLATELGLKDRAWLNKWGEIEDKADNEQRSSASESVDSATAPKK